MLVIPVWFNNSTSFFREDQKQEILTDLEYVFNTTRGEDGFHSVKQFYEEESNGLLNFDITISDFYESGTSSKIYGDTVEADVNRVRSLTDTAIDWYFNNHSGESRNDYDLNNDGYIDAVSLAYAANYYGTIGAAKTTTTVKKTNAAVAVEVLAGKWGNGLDRKKRLESAGYSYNDVQREVNKLLKATKKKSVTELAREVIAGKWGNGTERIKKLKAAGYDAAAVQAVVNKLMR